MVNNIRKKFVVLTLLFIGSIGCNQLIGEFFPFSDLPMYSVHTDYSEYYYISDTSGTPIQIDSNRLKKVFLSTLRKSGSFQFAPLSYDYLHRQGLLGLSHRFSVVHQKRKQQLISKQVTSNDLDTARLILQELNLNDSKYQLNRVGVYFRDGSFVRERVSLTRTTP